MLEIELVVHGITCWDGKFTDHETGEVKTYNAVTKLFYLSAMQQKEDRLGKFESHIKGAYHLFSKFSGKTFPVVCKCKVDLLPNTKGGTDMFVSDLTIKD